MEITRAFELPLAGLVAPGDSDRGDDRDRLWPLLGECWSHATDLANWCVLELLRRDHSHLAGVEKLPPMKPFKNKRLKGLYGLASEQFGFTKPRSWWAGACASASTICRDVEWKYRKERLNVLLRHKQALHVYRYPYPWPVRANQWKRAWFDQAGRPCIELSLPGGIVGVRLRGGPEFARQMSLFRAVVEGDLPRLQVVIRRQPCSSSCHRPGLIEKSAGGGQRRPQRVLIKMVARLPVVQQKSDRTILLTTDPNALLVASVNGRQEWVLNADHMHRLATWMATAEARRQRWAEDCKAERRSDSRRRLQFEECRQRASQKHDRRMKSWIQESAAHFAGFALRQRAGLVVYDDRERAFLPGFRWYALREALGNKLAEHGIVFNQFGQEEGDAA